MTRRIRLAIALLGPFAVGACNVGLRVEDDPLPQISCTDSSECPDPLVCDQLTNLCRSTEANAPIVSVAAPDESTGRPLRSATFVVSLRDLNGQPNGEEAVSLEVEYGVGNDPTSWFPAAATLPDGSPLEALVATSETAEVSVLWDILAATDVLSFIQADLDGDPLTPTDTVVGYAESVRLRVRATDSTALVGEALSPVFAIGNESPTALIDANVVARIERGDAPVAYTLEDSSSDISRIELEFRAEGETLWSPANLVLGSVDNLLPIEDQIYVAVWDTEDAVGGIGQTNQRAEIRIRGVDEPQDGEEHFGDWSPVLLTNIIRNQTRPEVLELEIPETFAGRGAGALMVVYRGYDEEEDPVDVKFEYALGAPGDWTLCSEYGSTSSSGVRDLATNNIDGVPHTFVWDTSALTFGFPTSPVFLRAMISDGFDNSLPGAAVIELGAAIGPLGAQPFRAVKNPIDEDDIPRAVAVSLFNGDSDPDLVVVAESNLYFFAGTPDGRFDPPLKQIGIGDLAVPRRTMAADIDHDGLLDFVAEADLGMMLAPIFFTNDGDGSFTEMGALPGGFAVPGPAVAFGQINADMLADVAYSSAGGLVVRPGISDMAPFYGPENIIDGMVSPTAVHIANVIGTMSKDIVYGTDAGKLVVREGSGVGVTFGVPNELDAPGAIDVIRTRDINGDGDLDIVTLSRVGRTVSVYTRVGPAIVGPQIIPVRPDPLDLELRDFNADGVQDIVVSFETGPTVSVFVGDVAMGAPLGLFLDPADFSAPGDAVGIMGAGDLDGDGASDLILPSDMPMGDEAAWLLRADNVSTIEPQAFEIEASTLIQGSDRVAVADLNADGGPEIIGALKDANTILGLGLGAFRGTVVSYADAIANPRIQPYQPNFVGLGDFDADGFVDAVHSSGGGPPASGFPNGLRVVLTDTTLSIPNGDFLVVRDDDTLNPDAVGVGKLNGDDFADLVIAQAGVVSFQLGDGAGGFAEVDTSPTDLAPPERVREILLVDINRDGRNDVIVPTSTPEIHLQASNGTFADPSTTGANSGVPTMAMEDFNGDGYWDIVSGGAVIVVRFGDGTGVFASPETYQLPTPTNGLVAIDVSGDGAVDLVATREMGGSLHYFLGITDRGLPTGDFLNPVEVAAGFASTSDLHVFDPDRDGMPDFVVGDTEASTIGLAFTGNDSVRQSHARPLRVVTSLTTGESPPLLFAPPEYVPSDPDRFGEFPVLTVTAHVARLMPQGRVPSPWAALAQEAVHNANIAQDVRRPITAPYFVTGDKRVKRTAGGRLRLEELYGFEGADGREGVTLTPTNGETAAGFVFDLPIFGSESDPASENVVVFRRSIRLRRSEDQPGDPLLGQSAGRFLIPENPLGGHVWVEVETWTEIPRAAGDDISVGTGARFGVLNGPGVVRVLTDELGVFMAYKVP